MTLVQARWGHTDLCLLFTQNQTRSSQKEQDSDCAKTEWLSSRRKLKRSPEPLEAEELYINPSIVWNRHYFAIKLQKPALSFPTSVIPFFMFAIEV